ncbi:hypothetical protein F2P56_029355 [Juglans regia]|uniref:Uncharacterized protein n=1 Tax=Juglans regia TaxID=51240 RepID=A0A833U2M0_JUGRE|nr:hypothetical protein F2P56_029355 [Juglans regia]
MDASFANKAMIFLIWLMALTFCPSARVEAGCSEEQNRALLEIRNSTHGLLFADLDGSRDCCSKSNILCDDDGKVIRIFMQDDYVKPPSIFKWYPNMTLFTLFNELDFLDLSSMNIGGELQGSIPISFQNLRSMESLDLSHNKLRGRIPSELVGLTSLSVFSVAYNNLSGRIPFECQFSTFTSQCYEGNSELCGDPLSRNCSTANQLEPEHKEQQKDEKEGNRMIDHPFFFYAFVTMSYALGFWTFFGILIIKKNWRHKYFKAVDGYIESLFELLSKYR